MSLTAKDMAGVHLIDLISLSNPEIASFGNTSNGAYIQWYHKNAPMSSYSVGLMNNSFNICSNVPIYTNVGIGTTNADSNVNLHVQGTIMASNISTYNANNTLTFNRQNIAGISNITFTGSLFQGNELFKTSQWETVNTTNIYFPGNVGVGGIPTGSDSNLFVVGDVVVTGKITAGSVLEKSTVLSRFSSISLHQPDTNGYKQIETSSPTYADRVLFSTKLGAGRYMVTSILPYKNLSTVLTLDTFNWAFIGLYKATPETYSSTSTLIRTVQLNNIGSTNEEDVDDVNISWFLEVPADGDYVVAINGKGHTLRFGPYWTEPVRLVIVPIKALGTGDSIDVRHSLQAKPIRKTIIADNPNYFPQNFFTVETDGYYDIHSSNVDLFIHNLNTGISRKLYWRSPVDNQFLVGDVTFSNKKTTAKILLNTPPEVNERIDVTVWLDNTASTYFEAGYLYQNFNISSIPWQIINGGGVLLPNNPNQNNKCVIDGDLIVSGNIYGGCNANTFEAGGIIADYLGNFEQSINIVNTLNICDKAVTVPKLDLFTGNVGIGTTSPPEKLMVAGNIAPGASNAYDLGTQRFAWKDIYIAGQIRYTSSNNTPPFVVTSSNQVANLNASFLQGGNSNYYRDVTNMNAGILSVIRGGTGVNTFSQNKLIVGSGTGALTSPSNLHWDSSTSGSLGIGTTNPRSTLDVLGDVRIQNATNARLNLTVGTTSGVAISTQSDSNLYINTNQSYSNVVILGSVGIGASNARKPLSVRGEIQSSSNILADSQFFGTSTSSNIPTYSWLSSPTTGILSPASNIMSFMTSNIERMRMISNGNIGIGTTNPESRFVISNTSGNVMSKLTNTDTASYIAFVMGYNDGKDFYIAKNQANTTDPFVNGITNNNALIRNSNADIYLQTNDFGLNSNAQMIYKHRPILSAYLKSSTDLISLPETIGVGSTSVIKFNNVNSVGTGALTYDTTTGKYTIPITGRYYISAKVYLNFKSYNLNGNVTTPTNPADGNVALLRNISATNTALTVVEGVGDSILRENIYLPGAVSLYTDTVQYLNEGNQISIHAYGTGQPRLICNDGRTTFTVIYLG